MTIHSFHKRSFENISMLASEVGRLIYKPKDILQEFADLTEEENVDPFAETQSQCQIAYHMPELESPAVYLMLTADRSGYNLSAYALAILLHI